MTVVRPRTGVGARRTAVARRNTRVQIVTAAALWCLAATTAVACAFQVVHTRRGACVRRSRQDWEEFIKALEQDRSFKTRYRLSPK
ncbi:unnamed protein product [Ectocarpus sp. CCAP 1310/34]|nr:unnamed protein product [Ectocarpus sp. CCAP 1310/34]